MDMDKQKNSGHLENISALVEVVRKKHFHPIISIDTLWIIVGREGMGKSTLALQIAEIYNPKFSVERIAWDMEDFVDCIMKAEKGDVIIFDEAGEGLFSRDFSKQENKDIVKLFMVNRASKFFTIMCIPSFRFLDKFFRQHRPKALLYIPKMGKVEFYDKQAIDKINEFYDGSIENARKYVESINDTFGKYEGELKEEYEKRKDAKIQNVKEFLYKKYHQKKDNGNQTEEIVSEVKNEHGLE